MPSQCIIEFPSTRVFKERLLEFQLLSKRLYSRRAHNAPGCSQLRRQKKVATNEGSARLRRSGCDDH